MSKDIINYRSNLLTLDEALRAAGQKAVLDLLDMPLGEALTLLAVNDIELKANHRPPVGKDADKPAGVKP